jgi:hypothetical protein
MESSTTKARESAAKYTSPTIIKPTDENKSTAIVPTGNTLPVMPEDPTKLESYIKSAQGLEAAAEAMRDKPGIAKEEYEHWDKVAKTCALAALDATLKLSLTIQELAQAPGYRTDKKPITDDGIGLDEEIIETKKLILQRDFNMNEQRANRIARLTVTACDVEKKRALDEGEAVSISRAYSFVEKKEASRKGGRKNAAAFNSSRPTKTVVLPAGKFNIIYTDLETARENLNLTERIIDPAILFLLVDPADQPKGLECVKYFGFEYQDCAVAMVDRVANQSGYLQSNHRHLLVATKGEFPKPDCRRLPSFGDGIALGGKDATEHFREAIKYMYPDGTMLDLVPATIDCEADEAENEGESHE